MNVLLKEDVVAKKNFKMAEDKKDDGYRALPMKTVPGSKIVSPGYCRGTCETENKCTCMIIERDVNDKRS